MTEVITELERLEPEAYERLKAEGRIIVRCKDCAFGRLIYGWTDVNCADHEDLHCVTYECAVPEDGYCWYGEES